MDIGKVLRDLIAKEGKSFRKTAIDLRVDRSTLHRSLKKGANPEWRTIQKVLDYLGYEITIRKSNRAISREGNVHRNPTDLMQTRAKQNVPKRR
jgi:DNA-binding phage protein